MIHQSPRFSVTRRGERRCGKLCYATHLCPFRFCRSFRSFSCLWRSSVSFFCVLLMPTPDVLAASAGQNPTILVAIRSSTLSRPPSAVATTEPLTDIVPSNIVYLPLVTQDLTIFLPVIFTKSSFQQPTPADNQNGVSLNAYLGWTFDDHASDRHTLHRLPGGRRPFTGCRAGCEPHDNSLRPCNV
jgi:hypothetical protein